MCEDGESGADKHWGRALRLVQGAVGGERVGVGVAADKAGLVASPRTHVLDSNESACGALDYGEGQALDWETALGQDAWRQWAVECRSEWGAEDEGFGVAGARAVARDAHGGHGGHGCHDPTRGLTGSQDIMGVGALRLGQGVAMLARVVDHDARLSTAHADSGSARPASQSRRTASVSHPGESQSYKRDNARQDHSLGCQDCLLVTAKTVAHSRREALLHGLRASVHKVGDGRGEGLMAKIGREADEVEALLGERPADRYAHPSTNIAQLALAALVLAPACNFRLGKVCVGKVCAGSVRGAR